VELGFSSMGDFFIPPGRGLKVELGFTKPGRPHNSTGARLLNHKTSKNSVMSFWMKISCGCLKFEDLKVELGFPSVGDPLIPPGRGF
jgi:hypothetical protein